MICAHAKNTVRDKKSTELEMELKEDLANKLDSKTYNMSNCRTAIILSAPKGKAKLNVLSVIQFVPRPNRSTEMLVFLDPKMLKSKTDEADQIYGTQKGADLPACSWLTRAWQRTRKGRQARPLAEVRPQGYIRICFPLMVMLYKPRRLKRQRS